MTDTKKGADKVQIEVLYVGLDREGKRHNFDLVVAGERERGGSYTKGRASGWGSPVRVGSVYSVDATDPGGMSITPSTMRFARLWPDQAERRELQAKADAHQRVLEGVKISKSDDWREALEPVRRAYGNSRGAAQAQLLARAVAFITGGGGR